MPSRQNLLALLTAGLVALPLSISAAPQAASAKEHAAHHPAASASAPDAAMDARMNAMREMHDKMMAARTPEERQALMADHMKAMQDGIQTMQGMSGPASMGGKAMRGRSDADMGRRMWMMEGRMEMMQMMMDMMMQRLPDAPVPKPAR